jgi:predicted RNase H-like HicB family nuclease
LQDHTIAKLQDDNGTFVAYVPAIQGCHAVGTTMEEAQANLAEVFQMMGSEYAEKGRTLPQQVLDEATDSRPHPPYDSSDP